VRLAGGQGSSDKFRFDKRRMIDDVFDGVDVGLKKFFIFCIKGLIDKIK